MKTKTWAFLLAGLALVAAAGMFLGSTEPARAGALSEELEALVEYIQGEAAWSLRLQALDVLKRSTDEGAEDALAGLAGSGDLEVAVYAAATLGRRGTSTARAILRDVVKATGADKQVRKAAMTAIAAHFKASSDLSWLESNTASDSDLKAHCQWLRSNVYER